MKKIVVFVMLLVCVTVQAVPIVELDGTNWASWEEGAKVYFLLGFVHALESMGFSLSWPRLEDFLADIDTYYEKTQEYDRPIWSVIKWLDSRNKGQSDKLEGETG